MRNLKGALSVTELTESTGMCQKVEQVSHESLKTFQPEGWVGRHPASQDDVGFLWGQGRYVADLEKPSTWHPLFVRSREAHVRVIQWGKGRRGPTESAISSEGVQTDCVNKFVST